MENWGLVTLSEEYLMEADDAHAIYLISHEIVHHWIGNLMTISDWSQACLQVRRYFFFTNIGVINCS